MSVRVTGAQWLISVFMCHVYFTVKIEINLSSESVL